MNFEARTLTNVSSLITPFRLLAIIGLFLLGMGAIVSTERLWAALLWGGIYVGIGYLFHGQIDRAFALVGDLGGWLVAMLIGGLCAYVAWKYLARQRFIRSLRVARIDPEELSALISGGHAPSVLDLRDAMSLRLLPESVPGAHIMTPEEVETRHHELPRDRAIILYCS